MLFRSSVGRHFLFLQGPGGRFFHQLSQKLESKNISVSRINVCAGDYIFWSRDKVVNYRGRLESWESYLRSYIFSHGVTDIVLFSDSRPYHRIARIVAEKLHLNLFVFENGYLRPNWITMELGGVNGNSRFPRIRSEVEQIMARAEPHHDELQRPTKLQSYWPDIKFHFANTLLAPLFPFYKRHRSTLPFLELLGHGKKWLTWPWKVRQSQRKLERLWRQGKPYYLFALQLEHDFQLVEHSPFKNLRQASERDIESFAQNAPKDTILLVKNHPLDNDLIDRRREIARFAALHSVSDRVVYIDTGPNPKILDRARGMVTINSTLGTSALFHRVPVCTLGRAVYDIDGLTHQLGLDAFWKNPTPPDYDFFEKFRQALIQTNQIRGRFVTVQGCSIAVRACVERMLATPYVASVRTSVTATPTTDIKHPDTEKLYYNATEVRKTG